MTAQRLDEDKIKRQAKAIMDEFVKALGRAGEIGGEVGIEREESTRKAKTAKPSEEFRKRVLANAPRKDEEHIIAEKKSW